MGRRTFETTDGLRQAVKIAGTSEFGRLRARPARMGGDDDLEAGESVVLAGPLVASSGEFRFLAGASRSAIETECREHRQLTRGKLKTKTKL